MASDSLDPPAVRARCPACGSGRGRPAGDAGGFSLRRCGACATLFTSRLPGPGEGEDYDAYYAAERGNLDVPPMIHERLRELVRGLAPYRRRNRWLDVGCGTGALLRAAVAEGWEATGTEVSRRPVEQLRAAGLDARVGTLAELALPAGHFDVVTLIEVVEHVPDPASLLADVAVLLRPGGALYLTTPNGRSLSARLLGNRWSVVSPPEHLQLLSLGGLRAMIREAGLEPTALRAHGVNPYELWYGALGRGAEVDRVQTAYALNAALTGSGPRALVRTVANGVLAATRLGDTLKLTAVSPSSPAAAPRGRRATRARSARRRSRAVRERP